MWQFVDHPIDRCPDGRHSINVIAVSQHTQAKAVIRLN
jgi:hypothetical protein